MISGKVEKAGDGRRSRHVFWRGADQRGVGEIGFGARQLGEEVIAAERRLLPMPAGPSHTGLACLQRGFRVIPELDQLTSVVLQAGKAFVRCAEALVKLPLPFLPLSDSFNNALRRSTSKANS